MISEMKERPPFIEFEVRAVEDRAKTIEEGHAVFRDVDFVKITPLGGNGTLVVERDALEWLAYHRDNASPLYKHFKECYDAWKAGQEMPESGTPIRMWPAITPAEVAQLLRGGCKTIEDLAAWPDGNIGKFGMGGVSLKQRAQKYLATAQNVGRVSEQAAAVEAQNKELQATVQAQAEQLKELAEQVKALSKKKVA